MSRGVLCLLKVSNKPQGIEPKPEQSLFYLENERMNSNRAADIKHKVLRKPQSKVCSGGRFNIAEDAVQPMQI